MRETSPRYALKFKAEKWVQTARKPDSRAGSGNRFSGHTSTVSRAGHK